jgi:uncharacterized protein YkwD
MITQLQQQMPLSLRIACIAVLALALPMHTTMSEAHSMPSPGVAKTNRAIGLHILSHAESAFQSVDLDQSSTTVVYTSDIFLPITQGTEKYPPDNRALELELLRLINEYRASNGLQALTENNSLTLAARRHAQDMAEHNLLSHTGTDNTRPTQRMADEGYTGIPWGEAAAFAPTPQIMFDAAISSLPHRDILLDSAARHSGIGFALRNERHVFVINTGH